MPISKQQHLAGAFAALALFALPQAAQANAAAMDYFTKRIDRSAVPTLLSAEDRTYYRNLFAAIDRGDWARVQALLAERPDGPLHQVARAEYYLAAGSPKIELEQLNAWLAGGVSLPQAPEIAALAQRRGATSVPALPAA
ncbi:MAG TPA: lytic transglycosylase domain-containing protein, partial [Novosphingobium sp.]|nr:lytic transglycosylase domain-containing protein [Novosphingobium sp.]